MVRAALYIRVSTEEQAIHGLSIEAQIEALEKWADGTVKIVDRYVDAGISARKPAAKRPELQRLLKDIRARKIDLVVFTKLDRWFRNIAEYYKVQEVLEKYHVNWKTIQEDYETATASGRLKVNIMLSVAQDEADRTGERIKAVHQSKLLRNEPISGKVPLGYKIENKKMVVDEEKVEIARDIFREYIACRSIRQLQRYISDRWGFVYCISNIRALLTNERYIGRAHGSDDFCPPIVSREDFELVGQIIKTRAERHEQSRTDRVYLFTGLVFCAECGNRMSAHTVHGKYIYYRCTRREKIYGCIHTKRTSELVLEKWLLRNLEREFERYNIGIEVEQKAKTEEVDVPKVKRKMEKLKDLYLNDLIDRDTYERDYKSLRELLERKPEAREPVNLSAISSALELYSGLSKSGKKEFWSRTVSKILVTKDDHFTVFPFSP